jgi:riboflavin-specific deaminase-like protein
VVDVSIAARPYVLLSVATSIDGYIDDVGPERLVLSNADDLDRVDQVRAECDAILIGATTLRRDNPRLVVHSAERRARREAAGRPAFPLRVTVTGSGDLDPELRFWHHGGDKLVYCPDEVVPKLRERLGDRAEVAGLGNLAEMLADLHRRGIERLMVEGGGTIHTQFLTAGLVDEIHLAVAPFLLGDPAAPRFVNPGVFPYGPGNRLMLSEARTVGDVALLRYVTPDRHWLSLAVELSRRSPPSDTAFSVGAVIVDGQGNEIGRGYSRERPGYHAEEVALSKLPSGEAEGATLYSSLEPCVLRASRPHSCTDLIVAAGIRRVVIAWREPPVFVPDPGGVEALRAAGVTVAEYPDLADAAAAANTHLLEKRT